MEQSFDRLWTLIGMILKVLVVLTARRIWGFSAEAYMIFFCVALVFILVKGTYDYWDWCRIDTLPPL